MKAWAWISPKGELVRLWPWQPPYPRERLEAFYGPGKLIEVKVEVSNDTAKQATR